MSSKTVVHITGPNGEQVPVCPFPLPAAADELISLEEWLREPPPAPKPTKADDGFGVYSSAFPQMLSLTAIWALEMG